MAPDEPRLDEFSMDEFWDAIAAVRSPSYTREQFEMDWRAFEAAKAGRKAH
jgi:hypothetical protein